MSIPFPEMARREAERAVRENLEKVLKALQHGDFSAILSKKQTPEEVKEDAKDRTFRTLMQQLGIDLVVAIATVLGPAVLSMDVSSKEQWTVIAFSLVKTIISTVVAYVFRLFYAPKEARQVSLSEAKA